MTSTIFAPISNLHILSKIHEKTVVSQIHDHLSQNSLHEQFQLGFRLLHSTETALVKITNDLLMAADSGFLTILILLDLNAAFDTIGFSDTPLHWYKSYLSGRTQFVQLKSFRSHFSPLSSGVPQGSVLGPLLFIIYLLPLGHIFRKNNNQIVFRKSDPGSLQIFSNLIMTKLNSSFLAPNPLSLK